MSHTPPPGPPPVPPAPRFAQLPPGAYGWSVGCRWQLEKLEGDELALVLKSLTTLDDLKSASCVCKAWSAAAAQEEFVWEPLVSRKFPESKHAAFYKTFKALGVTSWKSKCRLLLRDTNRLTAIILESGWGREVLHKDYTFAVTVADGEGNVETSAAHMGPQDWMEFCLATEFESPAFFEVGVQGDYLLEDEISALALGNTGLVGFGEVKVDVFARRNRDGKVAHIVGLPYTFKDSNNGLTVHLE